MIFAHRFIFIGEIVELSDEHINKYAEIIRIEVFLCPLSRK